MGTQSITKSGRQCQRWDSQSPHRHSYTADSMFPDATVADAGNFCRNPGGQKAGLWCYTSDRTKQWEYCDVPVCTGVYHIIHIIILIYRRSLNDNCVQRPIKYLKLNIKHFLSTKNFIYSVCTSAEVLLCDLACDVS